MGNLVAGAKTNFLTKLSTVQSDVTQLGTDYASLVSLLATLGVSDDSTRILGPGGRLTLDDILSRGHVNKLIAGNLIAAGLRQVLASYDDLSNTGVSDIVTLATNLVANH